MRYRFLGYLFGRVEVVEDGSICECRFKSLEGVLLGFSLFELLVFLGEEGKGFDNMGEVFDEPVVIVSEPPQIAIHHRVSGGQAIP